MLSAQDFYDCADEHFDWAETAKTERERAIFLQMAAAWLEVAQRWETPATRRAPQLLCEHRSDGGREVVPPAWCDEPLSRHSVNRLPNLTPDWSAPPSAPPALSEAAFAYWPRPKQFLETTGLLMDRRHLSLDR